ncbi:MAG: hypothetical protein WC705_00370 [Candidatus Paceibacterota bacterium]|jgi:hypothetical protein
MNKKIILILVIAIILVGGGIWLWYDSSSKKFAPDVLTDQFIRKYINDEYGFELTLTYIWKGYSIITESWEGRILSNNDEIIYGPKIIIRSPQWTKEQSWQDVPILIFTKAEWELIKAENLAVSAAPIGPSKLGENQKYIFALPPRWVGFTDVLGQGEAVEITKTFKAF